MKKSSMLPWKSSGAAYGGLPQNVSNLESVLNSLLKPKSAILMFISLSSSRFSACNNEDTRCRLNHSTAEKREVCSCSSRHIMDVSVNYKLVILLLRLIRSHLQHRKVNSPEQVYWHSCLGRFTNHVVIKHHPRWSDTQCYPCFNTTLIAFKHHHFECK